ncbi:MAG: ComF family protein [Flavobacterium sp.]
MLHHLLNLFFPNACAGCDSILLSSETIICTRCRHQAPLTHHHNIPNNEVIQKFYGRIPLEFGAAMLYFHKKGIVQEMMHKLKYKGQQEISEMIGNWYAEELKNTVPIQKIDCIIPVPLHPKRIKKRGYNQAEGFGKALSGALNIPYENKLLIRKVNTKTQTKKGLLGRADVNESVFDLSSPENHHGKHFLLIDDIITTGATLEACSRTLLKIPGAKISIVCMAMSHS